MKYGPLIFLAAFLALSCSWFGFILTPQIQIGREQQGTNLVNKAELYPQGRPGLAREGLEVYRANGCAYCHSQQVGQNRTEVNVILLKVNTNAAAIAEALTKANVGITNVNALGLSAGLPKTIQINVPIDLAKTTAKTIKDAGGDAKVEIVPMGPDILRGWGSRRTVAADFLFDSSALLGSQRIGPDLANAGTRMPDATWHLVHLYAPQKIVPGSPMPAYQFLFEKRKIGRQPSPDALKELSAPAGFEIVPRPEAKALVAYLQSLHAGTPLFEAPLTVAAPPAANTETNAPAK